MKEKKSPKGNKGTKNVPVEVRPPQPKKRWWSSGPFAKLLSPEIAFLVMGAICGIVFVFTTPPFEVPDEPQYFYRAYQISEFKFLDAVYSNAESATGGGSLGALLPKSLGTLVARSDLATTRFRPGAKLIPSKIFATLKLPLNPAEREYLPIASYPPASFIPQAIGITVGRLLRQPPLVLMYLGRLGALALFLTLVFLAIKNTPILKWTYFLLALMPMTLYLCASNSGDSVVISLSFLMSAILLKWVYDDTKESISRRDVICLALMAIGLAWSKAIYLAVIFLFLLIPQHKFKSRKEQYGTLIGVIAVAVAAYYMWGVLVDHTTKPGPTIQFAQHGVDPPTGANVSPRKQVEFILSNPIAFARILEDTASVFAWRTLYSFFGLLGWLDTYLPSWLPFVYAAMLITAALLSSSRQRITMVARLLSVSIFGATLFVSLLALYVSINGVGDKLIQGFQGRYIIPVAPLVFLLFQRNKVKPRPGHLIAIILMLFVTMTTSIAAYTLVDRFYGGQSTPVLYHIDAVSASPSNDALIVTGWAVDAKASNVANGVDVEIDGHYYPARYGIDRPDVADTQGQPFYRYSGFEGRIPAAELGQVQQHTLALRIKTRDQSSYIVPDPKLTLTAQ